MAPAMKAWSLNHWIAREVIVLCWICSENSSLLTLIKIIDLINHLSFIIEVLLLVLADYLFLL